MSCACQLFFTHAHTLIHHICRTLTVVEQQLLFGTLVEQV